MALTDDDLSRGIVRPGEAARTMGLTYDALLDAADREHIDYHLGFQVDDLIRLAIKLSATTLDPEQNACLRAAAATFRAIRDYDLAA